MRKLNKYAQSEDEGQFADFYSTSSKLALVDTFSFEDRFVYFHSVDNDGL